MSTHALPEGKTPYEMLYGKRPNLKNLQEWGNGVWVHTAEATKLDGQSKLGKWVGFDEISNGHQIYWPNKCSVTIECSVKFANGDMIIPSIPVIKPIQGEKEPRNMLQNDPEIRTETSNHKDESQEHTINHQQTSETSIRETENTPPAIQDQWRCAPFNQTTDELIAAQSC